VSTWCPRRHLLGLIALASFALAAIVLLCPPLASYQAAGTMALRVGLVLGVFWLAWPDLHRLPPWTWYVLPIGIVILIYARGALVFLIPLFPAGAILYMLYRKFRRSSSR